MSAKIQNMIHNALGDGARATKFDVNITFPPSPIFPDNKAVEAVVKSTSFPGKSNQKIDLKYMGRTIPIKGQVSYSQTWECTFYLNENHKLKSAFETWIESLDGVNSYFNNASDFNKDLESLRKSTLESYGVDVFIHQFNFDGSNVTATCILHNVFPTEISSVQYDYESIGKVQEFTVTFAYSHYNTLLVDSSTGKNLVDKLVDSFKAGATGLASKLLSAAKDKILGSLTGGLSGLMDSSLGKKLVSKAEELSEELGDPNKMLDKIVLPGKLLSGGIGTALSGVGDMASSALSGVGGMASSALSGVSTAVGSLTSKIKL